MECPRCSSTALLYKDTLYMTGMSACVCMHCGMKFITHRSIDDWRQFPFRDDWAEYRSPPPFLLGREISVLFRTYVAYIWRGVIVWMIMSLIQYMLCVINPWSAIFQIGADWVALIIIIIFFGGVIGTALSTAILIGGSLFPKIKVVHIGLPLLLAMLIGMYQGLLWAKPDFLFLFLEIPLRSNMTCAVIGALLAMAATPIIIVRSSSALRKEGLRPPLPTKKDRRWQS